MEKERTANEQICKKGRSHQIEPTSEILLEPSPAHRTVESFALELGLTSRVRTRRQRRAAVNRGGVSQFS